MPETTPDQSGDAPDPGLARLNTLSRQDLRTELAQCLNVDRWVEAVASEAPYADRRSLLSVADAHAREITSDEVATALARHPRIGEKAKGKDTESAWSRGEQSAFAADTDDASARVQRIFTFAQGEYEGRFGQIYLVCASGRSSRELLADLVGRLGNDPETELTVVGEELRRISGLRLVKLLEAA
ncbi:MULTISPECIES: 2-oxo-4-hydroxy-4-carboxy-5-ureidoimidazoline decarboxylase [unclassified Nocardiopsis]|uniref:2-oxo-4-hydroxy-4-carboxy-5-ureidoimidazoline decarboxylase n=1 Tax=unclassified Nocardiopsis TaxID=2649073 RepID=UPI00066D08D7|nr:MULTISPECIES: 2-oxo-4-hydroxy-4-carboxy-5-ureidoimidazoline decarboxylase [unclassified Nocardiopsis]MBQ1083030.1 2-oxo-4-hydroxy-4-carboxy-5-ureidoimidazoline decarboxylase [Nocardiopsis sp. B62]